MKKLLTISIILAIGVYISVQYYKDRRFNPPSQYDYALSSKIDKNFYDPMVVKNYYETALEAGTYARMLWNKKDIDVRFMDDESFESTKATDYYNSLIVTAKLLETKLEKSTALKSKGYSNLEIKRMFEEGIRPQDLIFEENSYLLGLKKGHNGSAAWEFQKLLNAKGDSVPVDGIFSRITVKRLQDFQKKNKLFPSGEIDKKTLKALLN